MNEKKGNCFMLFFFKKIKDGYTVLILYSMHRVVLKAFG